MRVNVRGNDLVKMSESAKEYITSRVESLKKLFNQSENVVANVLCKGTEKNVIVEITIPLKHIILRAESKADTLYGAVDFATDKIERQLLKLGTERWNNPLVSSNTQSGVGGESGAPEKSERDLSDEGLEDRDQNKNDN